MKNTIKRNVQRLFMGLLSLSLLFLGTLGTIHASENLSVNEEEKNIEKRDATSYHGVVQSYTYKVISKDKYVGTVVKTKTNMADFLMLMIPYYGALYAQTIEGKVYRKYATTYDYTCVVAFYDSMGHYLFTQTYKNRVTGYSYVAV